MGRTNFLNGANVRTYEIVANSIINLRAGQRIQSETALNSKIQSGPSGSDSLRKRSMGSMNDARVFAVAIPKSDRLGFPIELAARRLNQEQLRVVSQTRSNTANAILAT